MSHLSRVHIRRLISRLARVSNLNIKDAPTSSSHVLLAVRALSSPVCEPPPSSSEQTAWGRYAGATGVASAIGTMIVMAGFARCEEQKEEQVGIAAAGQTKVLS